MKKYGKFASVGLFVFLGIFILLQYQNCGNSSSSSGSSSVGLDGISYSLTTTVQSPVSHLSPSPITVQVVSSASVQINVLIGYFLGGKKQLLCTDPSPGGATNWQASCTTNGIPVGTQTLYVDVIDPQFSPNDNNPAFDCSGNALVPGCAGTYQITVQ
jgi:hypothetical protein